MFASAIYSVINKSISLRFSKLCYWLGCLNWYYLYILFFLSRLLFSALLTLTFLKLPWYQPSIFSTAASYQMSFFSLFSTSSVYAVPSLHTKCVHVRACVRIFLLRLSATEYFSFSTHCWWYCNLLASNSLHVVMGYGVALASPFMCVVVCNQITAGHTAFCNQHSAHSHSCNLWFTRTRSKQLLV